MNRPADKPEAVEGPLRGPKIAPKMPENSSVKPTTSKMQLASHDSGRWKIVNLEMFERQNLGENPFARHPVAILQSYRTRGSVFGTLKSFWGKHPATRYLDV